MGNRTVGCGGRMQGYRQVQVHNGATVTLCGRGTSFGPAAEASQHGFAPCVLDPGHQSACDSGPVSA